MKLKDWRAEDLPREKVLRQGTEGLSNAELLAIFISSGTPGTNALDAAQELLSSAGGRLTELGRRTPRELTRQRSVGPARAVAIAAALELGRRFLLESAPEAAVITGPEDVFRRMLPRMKGLDHEECWALYLNRSNRIVGEQKMTSGTAESTLIDARRIVRDVLGLQARAVILVHNHPSGSPLPGQADIQQTRRLQLALKTFEVQLFDHVIIGDGCYYSFESERVTKKRL